MSSAVGKKSLRQSQPAGKDDRATPARSESGQGRSPLLEDIRKGREIRKETEKRGRAAAKHWESAQLLLVQREILLRKLQKLLEGVSL